MNWHHTYDIPGVARETCDASRVLVPRKSLIEKDTLYKNSVTDDKLFWDWIPIHADTSLCYVTSSESSWSGNKYWKQTGKQINFLFFLPFFFFSYIVVNRQDFDLFKTLRKSLICQNNKMTVTYN